MMFETIDVKPMTGTIGAEVSNVDFAAPLSNQQRDEIHRALLDNLVIVFRDQELTPQKQVEVAKIFGKPATYPFLKGLDETPEVNVLAKSEKDERELRRIMAFRYLVQTVSRSGNLALCRRSA